MKILVTPAALQDLKDIRKYISDELSNPTAATNTVKRIIKTYSKLETMPQMGTLLQQSLHLNSPFRFLPESAKLTKQTSAPNKKDFSREKALIQVRAKAK